MWNTHWMLIVVLLLVFTSSGSSKDVCPIPADVALVLDASDNIIDKDWKTLIGATKRWTDKHGVSEAGNHVGVVTFSTTATLEIAFDDFMGADRNVKNIKDVLDLLLVQSNDTYIDKGLQMANNDLFDAAKGMRNVNKYCILITDGVQTTSGDYTPPHQVAKLMKDKDVTVYLVPVGDVDIEFLYQIASSYEHILPANSYDTVYKQLDKISNMECQGCSNIDLVLGIPDSPEYLPDLKNVISDFLTMFNVSKTLTHIGVVTYNRGARVYQRLDQDYNIEQVKQAIASIRPASNYDLNVAAALRLAADHVFSVYCGVRQSYAKAMVVFVPTYTTSGDRQLIAAANKLTSMGVRLMVAAMQNSIDTALYSSIVSQPPSEFLVMKSDFFDLSYASYHMSRAICRPPARKKCFQPFEMAIVIDTSETVTRTQFQDVKEFVKRLLRPYALSENTVHIGLMTFASKPQKITKGFHHFQSEAELQEMIDLLEKTEESGRRVDSALRTAQSDFFSIEGGTRRGHPKYLMVIVSGPSSLGSEDVRIVAQDLDDLGVQRIVVGTNTNDDTVEFIQKLASENKLVFASRGNSHLQQIAEDIDPMLCPEKPGTCPVPLNKKAQACRKPIPPDLIPCGLSVGKPSRAGREDDWDCPGELKCCYLDDTKCHQVCRYPPIACGEQRDLLIVLEDTDEFGDEIAFENAKSFAQDLVGAFDIRPGATHLSLATYGEFASAKLNFTEENKAKNMNNALAAIQQIKYRGGRMVNTNDALVLAHSLLQPASGARYKMNKTVVLIGTGEVRDEALAASLAYDVRSNLADVFVVTVGDRANYATLLKDVVSTPKRKTLFTTSTPRAMKAQLRSVVEAVCDGAIKDRQVGIKLEPCIYHNHAHTHHQTNYPCNI